MQTDDFGTARAELVFTSEDGRLINPERFTTWFERHGHDAGLPVIRLHEVRHSYASVGQTKAIG